MSATLIAALLSMLTTNQYLKLTPGGIFYISLDLTVVYRRPFVFFSAAVVDDIS
jgi:hypothetical protein